MPLNFEDETREENVCSQRRYWDMAANDINENETYSWSNKVLLISKNQSGLFNSTDCFFVSPFYSSLDLSSILNISSHSSAEVRENSQGSKLAVPVMDRAIIA
jgi:hypothetical protein